MGIDTWRVAAEARIAELEEQERNAGKLAVMHLESAIAANARADAAEKGEKDAVEALDANWVQHQRIVAAEQVLTAATELLKRWMTLSLAGSGDRILLERDTDAFVMPKSAPAALQPLPGKAPGARVTAEEIRTAIKGAAQPAPAQARIECKEHEAPLANEAFFRCGCRYVQPAPAQVTPAQIEAALDRGRDDVRKMREQNAIDQAVLDAAEAFFDAAEAFFDARDVEGDERAFEGLMEAVAAQRKARETP